MASAYSQDLRDRVIDAVLGGGMSRRAAADRFEVSKSSAIKWVQRFERSGSRAASKMGGYLRPRLEPHREYLEGLRAEKSDITLQALCDRLLAEPGVRADTAMMSRFFRRIGVTLKKKTLIAREQDRADIKRHRGRWRSHQKRVDPSRLVFIDETWTKTNMTRRYGWPTRGAGLSPRFPTAIGRRRHSWPRCAMTASTRPACSTVRPMASAFLPTSNSSWSPRSSPTTSSCSTIWDRTKAKRFETRSGPPARVSSSRPNTRPTSTRSSSSSPSSKATSEKPRPEPSTPYPTQSPKP